MKRELRDRLLGGEFGRCDVRSEAVLIDNEGTVQVEVLDTVDKEFDHAVESIISLLWELPQERAQKVYEHLHEFRNCRIYKE